MLVLVLVATGVVAVAVDTAACTLDPALPPNITLHADTQPLCAGYLDATQPPYSAKGIHGHLSFITLLLRRILLESSSRQLGMLTTNLAVIRNSRNFLFYADVCIFDDVIVAKAMVPPTTVQHCRRRWMMRTSTGWLCYCRPAARLRLLDSFVPCSVSGRWCVSLSLSLSLSCMCVPATAC